MLGHVLVPEIGFSKVGRQSEAQARSHHGAVCTLQIDRSSRRSRRSDGSIRGSEEKELAACEVLSQVQVRTNSPKDLWSLVAAAASPRVIKYRFGGTDDRITL